MLSVMSPIVLIFKRNLFAKHIKGWLLTAILKGSYLTIGYM